jgi:hypothetical protein
LRCRAAHGEGVGNLLVEGFLVSPFSYLKLDVRLNQDIHDRLHFSRLGRDERHGRDQVHGGFSAQQGVVFALGSQGQAAS